MKKILTVTLLSFCFSSFANLLGSSVVAKYSQENKAMGFETVNILSGDIVGNGWISPKVDENEIEKLFLSPEEIERRNDYFENFLEQIGVEQEVFQSGDVVGNGSGFFETQGAYFMESMPKNIIEALNQKAVVFHSHEKEILLRILDNLQTELSPVLIVSESDFPGLFFNRKDERSPRIAKTGFSSGLPIFINRDVLDNRTSVMDTLYWVGLLTHELGHQAGVASHFVLDKLAAKIRLVLSLGEKRITFPAINSEEIKVEVINHHYVQSAPDLYVSQGKNIVSISEWDSEQMKEACGELLYTGFELSNLHWLNYGTYNSVYELELSLGAWARVRCVDPETKGVHTRYKDLKLDIFCREDGLAVRPTLK
jgi:hypothetical protein